MAGIRQKIIQGYLAQNQGLSEPDRRQGEAEFGAALSLASQIRAVTLGTSLGDTGLTMGLTVEAEPGTQAGRLLSAEPGPRPAVADYVSGDALVTITYRSNQKALTDYIGYACDTLIATLDKARASKALDAKATVLAAMAACDGGSAGTVDLRVKTEGGSIQVLPEYFGVESGHIDRDLERRRVALAAKFARLITLTAPSPQTAKRVTTETSIVPDAATILGVSFDRLTAVSRIGDAKLSETQQYFGVVNGFAVSANSQDVLRARLPALAARRTLADAIATPTLPGEWYRLNLYGPKLVDCAAAAASLDPKDADVKAAVGRIKAEYGAGGPVTSTLTTGGNRAIVTVSIPYPFMEASIHLGAYAHGKGLDADTVLGWFRPYGLAGAAFQPRPAPQKQVLSEWVRRSNLAGRLLSEGRYADSLTEYAWCYDHSDEGQRVAAEFRASQALRGMARVGAHYPPALDAVRERRTRVEANLKARPNEPEALSRLIEVNRLLREPSATLAFFDRLPEASPARATLLPRLFGQFVEAKRYADALKARPYEAYARQFAQLDELKAQEPESNLIVMQTTRLVTQGVMEAEALAGTGDTATARQLVERILKLRDTPFTRSSLRRHLERVGHADWISNPAPPAAVPAGP
jgi:hypothetical protein